MKLPGEWWGRCIVVSLVLHAGASARPQTVESYAVNDGVNGSHDPANGELAPDVGGSIYFSRYAEATHAFAVAWNGWAATHGQPTFDQMMRAGLMDLEWLENELTMWRGGTAPPAMPGSVLPSFGTHVEQDPRTEILPPTNPPTFLPLPLDAQAWWNASGGGPRQILYWPYTVNGAAFMVCMGGDGNGQPMADPDSDGTRSLMVYNYFNHPSSFGINPNQFDDIDLRREFSRSFHPSQPFAEAFFDNDPANPWLGPKEQAIEAGDIVVFCRENFGMSIPMSLARTQEAVIWVKNDWAANVPMPLGSPSYSFTIDGAYTHGNSFGQAMSMFLCLAQPQLYKGAVDWITSDLGFELGDFSELQWDFSAALDRAGFRASTDLFLPDVYSFIDQLGCRFDEPIPATTTGTGWDVAIFSANRRPGDVTVPLSGNVGEHEFQFPGDWSLADDTLNPKLALTPLRNRSHEEARGAIPGFNEYTIFSGNEWSDAKTAGAANGTGTSVPIVPQPPALPPAKPYPDPYTHTLRPPSAAAVGQPVLTQLDLRFGMDATGPNADYTGDGYRKQANASQLKSIGQGIWPGHHDQMRVADLDGDGRMEVVFGNLEGHVHVLEFAGGANLDDPYRLIDEWQSPKLGRAVFASDAFFVGTGSNKLAQMFFADGRGQVWRINATAADTYQIANGGIPLATPTSFPSGQGQYLYDGSTPLVFVADVDGGNTGREIVVLNRFFDWALYTINGVPINTTWGSQSYGRLTRSSRTMGPTDAFVVELDGADATKEVLLSSANGFAWTLDRSLVNPSSGAWGWNQPRTILPFSACVYAKVVPVHFGPPTSVPTHLLAFTDGADRPLLNPPQASSQVELWTFPPPGGSAIKLGSAPSDVPLDEKLSFAWLSRPIQGAAAAQFVIANGTMIQKFSFSVGGAGSIGGIGSKSVVPPPDPIFGAIDMGTWITSVEVAELETGAGGTLLRVIYADCKGRIYVLDDQLNYLRLSGREFGSAPSFNLPAQPTGENPYVAMPWPSNRTLAQTPACDFVQGLSNQGEFYFAETALPALQNTVGSGSPLRRFRIGKISIGTGAGGGNGWTPFVDRAESGFEWDQLTPHWTRTLQVEDFDDDGNVEDGGELEHRVFTETGVAFYDDAKSALREFQTSSYAPNWMGGWQDFLTLRNVDGYSVSLTQGGRVFERLPDRGGGDYWHLGGSGFTVPVDGHFASFGSGDGWWYRRKGAEFMSGQIASNMQSAHSLSLGTSMKKGMIRIDADDPPVPHVVVGTTGGFVYAIRPTGAVPIANPPTPANGEVDAVLHQLSPYLGTYVVGLDVGNLDDDPDDEIACGTLVDDGTYVDWTNPLITNKNRAHLHLLDPVPSGTGNIMSEIVPGGLTGDDLMTSGLGIGAGVTGVKIDDVDDDGDNEIWCSDAVGFIYLFGRDSSGVWKCIGRSSSVASYPGFYNNLHPVKGGSGKTRKLVVQAPGYTMLFDVAHELVELP